MNRYVALGLLALGVGGALLLPDMARTQTASDDWEPPLTPHGHPDLQGNWTNQTLTPFERPEGRGPVLTREEVAAIEGGQAETVAERTAPVDPDRALPPGGDHRVCIDGATTCYDEFYREPGDRVAIVNGEPRSSLVTHPPDGRVPDLTPEARRRLEEAAETRSRFGEFDHPELRPLSERCIVSFGSSAGPPMLPNYWYNNSYTIAQNEDFVVIMAEMVHDARIIPLRDPTQQPGEPELLRQSDVGPWFGDSWGYWEGGTLIVETTNLNPEHAFRGVPPSKDRKVIERFTRVDEETILYEFTIDDPGTYTSSWGGQVPFKRFDHLLYEYACHEGNYAMSNVLSGARYQERMRGDR
ncbi:hypothetical protein [Candidatus Palauibacter sp.]|uniref:hypothetical protein n=1 Tax=Candidatus Palauibacter sp. TaxID=3101350 RepID=UPI003B5A9BD9